MIIKHNNNNHHHHHVLYVSKNTLHIAKKQNIFNLMASGNNRKLRHSYIHRTGSCVHSAFICVARHVAIFSTKPYFKTSLSSYQV